MSGAEMVQTFYFLPIQGCCWNCFLHSDATTKMDTEPDITITQHAVQDKPLTPGITPDYMKQQGHQGHPAAALSSGSLSDGWSGCTHAYVHEGICVHGP